MLLEIGIACGKKTCVGEAGICRYLGEMETGGPTVYYCYLFYDGEHHTILKHNGDVVYRCRECIGSELQYERGSK